MPITRTSKIDPISSVAQLLSFLQLEGHLDHIEVPDWATGTSVEELMTALETLGNGEWLRGVHQGAGALEAADSWISDFLKGNQVVTPDDILDAAGVEPDESIELDIPGATEDSLDILSEYLRTLPASRKAPLIARLEDPDDLGDIGPKHVEGIAMSIGACGFADDAQFKAFEPPFLTPSYAKDADLAAMSLHFLESRMDAFIGFGLHGAALERADNRAKALLNKVHELIRA